MQNIIFDTRWIGGHGIGRFAKELKNGIEFLEPIKMDGNPAGALDCWNLTKYLKKNKGMYFSPGYNAPLAYFDRCVLTVHDLNHVDIDSNTSFLKKLYYNLILKRACKKVKKILTVSEFSKQRICEWTGVDEQKVIVVGNGVSASFTPNGNVFKMDSKYVLSIGNRKKHKNESRAIEAFSKSTLSLTHKFLFTGDASEELESIIKKYSLQGKVIFLGKVSDEHLAEIYRGAEMLLFPSLYEGFGLPVVEAMACGTPVITSNGTSLREVAGDAAVLVDPSNVDDITAAIARINSDIKYKNELIDKGLSQSQKYTWEKTIDCVKNVLLSLD
ncbi:glycosyltransferase family 4 protein [Raoultella terrigena]|uniref:glycosyltransferase family 4 protein n=1 Tax=Raoultella terrigena TaxID=577 RepID=UPI001F5216E2|nr:glycosyltransferase family 1 protein [Raoultella terrigena]MCI1030787.1 glycosyltransferase family 4 protein [Raoultella terrigena]